VLLGHLVALVVRTASSYQALIAATLPREELRYCPDALAAGSQYFFLLTSLGHF